MTAPDWRIFPSREALAETLADDVAAVLSAAIEARGNAVLAVSGGTTPGRFFDALSKRSLDWANVVVTLVDERFVPETHDRSNARLVSERLLVNEARLARFLPLYHDGTADEAARQAEAGFALFGARLDAAILGMGTDGHTASFFPDADELAALLQPTNPRSVLPVHAPSAGEPRLTFSLARLLETGFLALHIEGDEKRAVLDNALAPGGDRPVSAVFTHSHRPVPVYWAG